MPVVFVENKNVDIHRNIEVEKGNAASVEI